MFRRSILLMVFALVTTLVAISPASSVEALGSVSGTVTSAATTDPIAGITVEVYDAAEQLAGTAETIADGTYAVADLVAGDVTVKFVENDPYYGEWYEGEIEATATTVTVADATDTPGIDADLDIGAHLNGTVLDAVSGDPVQGIAVEIYSLVDDTTPLASDITSVTGAYSFEGLDVGDVKVLFTDGGFNYLDYWIDGDSSYDTALEITLSLNSGYDDVVIEMYSGAFTDVDPHDWYFEAVEGIYGVGITAGYEESDGSFTYRPQNDLNRAEMAVFIVQAMGLPVLGTPAEDPFSDVNKDIWYAQYVQALTDAGIVEGYPDGTFRPGNRVSRAEVAVFIVRAKSGTPDFWAPTDLPVDPQPFTDVASTYWGAGYIDTLKTEGVTSGYEDGSYKPSRKVTRAEIAMFLYNAFVPVV